LGNPLQTAVIHGFPAQGFPHPEQEKRGNPFPPGGRIETGIGKDQFLSCGPQTQGEEEFLFGEAVSLQSVAPFSFRSWFMTCRSGSTALILAEAGRTVHQGDEPPGRINRGRASNPIHIPPLERPVGKAFFQGFGENLLGLPDRNLQTERIRGQRPEDIINGLAPRSLRNRIPTGEEAFPSLPAGCGKPVKAGKKSQEAVKRSASGSGSDSSLFFLLSLLGRPGGQFSPLISPFHNSRLPGDEVPVRSGGSSSRSRCQAGAVRNS
jgi:hypothetical protein